jgi:3-dehydroquinate synthetase
MYIINKLFYDDKYNDINIDILQMIPDKYKNIKISYNEFINHLSNDKKNDGDNICFILLDNIGISIFKYYKISEIEQKTKQIFDLLFINIF